MKFQDHKSIGSKNIAVLVKVGTLKSANPIYFQYISKNIELSIKWAVVILLTPNLVSRHKMVILFECLQKISKIYCSFFIFYCSLLFVNNRTMGFPKIDKGTLITIFFLDFSGRPNFFFEYGTCL